SEGKGKCVLCAGVAERACQRCGDFYCCKDCQVNDWQRHRYICFPIPALVHPSSFSLHQVTDELSILGRLTAAPDNEVDMPPPPARAGTTNSNSNLNRDQSVSSTRSVTHQENPDIPGTTNQVSNGSVRKYKIKHISNVSMPPPNTVVYLSGFCSSNRCYIRDAREPADVAYKQVCEKINAVGNEMPKVGKLHIYDYCLARHNGTFHRAQVLNMAVNRDVKIMLIDQGTVKLRNRSDLREINEELLSLPCYCKVVQLKDVPHKNFNDVVPKFLSQFEGEKFLAVYIKTPGHISVDLIHPITMESLNLHIREFIFNKTFEDDLMRQTSNKELTKPQSSLIETSKNELIKHSNEVNSISLSPELPKVSPEVEAPKEPLNVPKPNTTFKGEAGKSAPIEMKKYHNLDDLFEDFWKSLSVKLPEQGTSSKNIINNSNNSVEDDLKPPKAPEPIDTATKEASSTKFIYPVDDLKLLINMLKAPEPIDTATKEASSTKIIYSPFQIQRFIIDGKDGIDVFVVDNSRIDRGIFGAFDSSYAAEFSSLNSQLSTITDSAPYKPAVKEYVIAKYKGSWHRGKVEQIKTSPNQETKYRVLYVDFTNVEDITEQDIRRYPINFTTPCSTNICVIEGFPHKPNAAQLSYLSEVLQPHSLVHIDSVSYLTNVAMIKSRAIMAKLNSL
ncbi:hypothetical protein KR074_008317, partial [Drosophila pseudoananassae]